MQPTSPVKRAGGRLRRLLASLRPPARKSPLPVQTGFPTSLADLVVKNHDRLRKPRRRRRATAAPAPPSAVASAPAAVEEPATQERRELSVAQDAAVRAPAPGRPGGASSSIRPEVLAVAGVLALSLLVIWGKWLVAAATLASVALFWIESVRSPGGARWRRPETAEQPDSRCRGVISPIREAESPAQTPRPSCAASDTGSEASSALLWAATDTTDLAGDDAGSISLNKGKEKRRSLRKLLAEKLQNGSKRPKEDKDSRHGGESERPGPGEASAPEPAVAEETAPPPEAVTDERRHRRRRRGAALPLTALVPLVLVGLMAGKLPAVALTVLCGVFFTSVDRAPETAAEASCHGSDDPSPR